MISAALPDRRLTVEEFFAWAAEQPKGRFELVDGEVVAMSPERVRHVVGKGAVYRALRDAVREAGAPCSVFTDGVAIVIDGKNAREPDASVQCGPPPDGDAVSLDRPVIVVEVTSPSSVRTDEDLKLVEYFQVPSIQHYLVVHHLRGLVVHHCRTEAGDIRTRIVTSGPIEMAPPGISVLAEQLLEN